MTTKLAITILGIVCFATGCASPPAAQKPVTPAADREDDLTLTILVDTGLTMSGGADVNGRSWMAFQLPGRKTLLIVELMNEGAVNTASVFIEEMGSRRAVGHGHGAIARAFETLGYAVVSEPPGQLRVSKSR